MPRPTLGTTDVKDAPTTPLRIMIGIVEAAAFVAVHLVLIVINADIPISASAMIGGFILVQEGIDVRQWKWKRDTDIDYQLAKSGSAPRTVVTAEHATVTAERAEVNGTIAAPVVAALPDATPGKLPTSDEAGPQ